MKEISSTVTPDVASVVSVPSGAPLSLRSSPLVPHVVTKRQDILLDHATDH